jgi:hypothetical protein
MKTLLPVISILMVLFLLSCKEREGNTEIQGVKPQQQKLTVADVHTVVVQEVISGNSYTYLKVKEEDSIFWIAITKREMKTGETISFKDPLEMKNFTSKELQKTFETIYLVSGISNGSSPSGSKQSATNPHEKTAIEKKEISIEPTEGGISIGELFSKKDSYANKVVRIKGQVVKFNRAIMGKNWVHLQDGTGELGNNDLLVTTQDVVAIGDVVVFEGTIALNKDFGSGYSYEILMEEAKQQP